MTRACISAMVRPLIESQLPDALEVDWFMSADEAQAKVVDADIAWVDMNDKQAMHDTLMAGEKLQWVSSIYAGLDHLPVEALAQRGTIVTNGVGINTIAVAEYAVMGVLARAKGFADVVRAGDRAEWLHQSPGVEELYESRALIIGYGAIGRAIGDRLKAFGVDVTGVARTARPDEGVIGADDWKAQLGDFDWIIIATPATQETQALIGADELTAMKSSAQIINIARGECLDQDALVTALTDKTIAGAFLDVTDPEPLPADHPLWSAPNCEITMHLSGRAQTKMFPRSAALFLANVDRFLAGEPLENTVDLALGY